FHVLARNRLRASGWRAQPTHPACVRNDGAEVRVAEQCGRGRRLPTRFRQDRLSRLPYPLAANQSMKPTTPWQCKFDVFATTPCHGLSLSRYVTEHHLGYLLRAAGKRGTSQTVGPEFQA